MDRDGSGTINVQVMVLYPPMHLVSYSFSYSFSLALDVSEKMSQMPSLPQTQEFLAAAMDQNRISGLPILWEVKRSRNCWHCCQTSLKQLVKIC